MKNKFTLKMIKTTKKKTITFDELLEDNDKFYITYARPGCTPKHTTLEKPEDVLSFISNNIYEMNLIAINDFILDIDKIIEKYSK